MTFLFIFSLIFDFLLMYFIPLLNHLFIYFSPLLFVSTSIVYLMHNLEKKGIKYRFLGLSILYDLAFGNIYFLYLLIFFILYIEVLCFSKVIRNYYILFIITIISFIFLKYLILLFSFNYSISFLYTVILHNLTLNIVYGMVLCYLLGIKKKRS